MADRGRGRGGGRGRGRGDFQGGPQRGGYGGDRGGGFQGGPSRGGYGGDRGGGSRGGDRGRGGFRGRGGPPPQYWGHGVFPQPNAEIDKQETKSISDVVSKLSSLSLSVQDQLPRRPGYGTAGRKIVLWANYFELQVTGKDVVYHRYAVSFAPDNNISKSKKKRLIQMLLQLPAFSGIAIASDWAQILVAAEDIKLEGNSGKSEFQLEWYPQDGEPMLPPAPDDSEQKKAARAKVTHRVLVEKLGDISLAEMMKDLSTAASYSLKLETIQALNVIMSYGPSLDSQLAVVGQNRSNPMPGHPQFASHNLGGGLQAFRGFFSSVRTSVNRIILNLNVATAAFYNPGPLSDLIREGGEKLVRKLSFETNYIPQLDKSGKPKKGPNGQILTKRKVHIVTSVPADKNCATTKFEYTNPQGQKKQISVQEYFRQAYGIRLKQPNGPVVNYGDTKSPKWIPAELCTVIPGQPARRVLLGEQTRQMIEFAARRPFDNAESIMNSGLKVAKVGNEVDGHLIPFGIKVKPEMLTVFGRILNPPALSYRAKKITPSDGKWNLDTRFIGNKPFMKPTNLPSWNCLIINEGQRENIYGGKEAARNLLGFFQQTLVECGVAAAPCGAIAEAWLNPDDLLPRNNGAARVKETIMTALRTQLKAPPSFLFVLLASESAIVYDMVKTICDLDVGIPSVCNIGRKFTKEKGQAQYFANVALKFNQKLGGVNHTLTPDLFKPLDAQTIVFGIDVTHPSPSSSDSSPSIAGIVASVDNSFSQFPASMRTQTGRVEMVEALEEMIVERLNVWRERNQSRLPTKVIVYRDGVSEGQYRLVMEKEYPSFVKAFNRLYGDTPKHPKMSIIIVGKRHHTRFYPTKAEDADANTGNPKPGTVVDRGVTGEKLFDFFLLAHQGLQGTSKPAHYVVIKDDNKLGADELQKLTHNLCYTFARATRSVSVCPPAYYADLLCERGRSYLHTVLKGADAAFTTQMWTGGVHERVAHTMFYL
ncbi:Piwi-domain-containing protein [Polyplosphaeria fusca]|uniref:Piwi-domain-containing protein n=1 Tax=Polyplosphaeria fusca TaxID=682080 RepID=A0A9P4R4Y9_9PLEO|nr:Piwi-domain-containing protein [Polyplosphaeria fusca]